MVQPKYGYPPSKLCYLYGNCRVVTNLLRLTQAHNAQKYGAFMEHSTFITCLRRADITCIVLLYVGTGQVQRISRVPRLVII